MWSQWAWLRPRSPTDSQGALTAVTPAHGPGREPGKWAPGKKKPLLRIESPSSSQRPPGAAHSEPRSRRGGAGEGPASHGQRPQRSLGDARPQRQSESRGSTRTPRCTGAAGIPRCPLPGRTPRGRRLLLQPPPPQGLPKEAPWAGRRAWFQSGRDQQFSAERQELTRRDGRRRSRLGSPVRRSPRGAGGNLAPRAAPPVGECLLRPPPAAPRGTVRNGEPGVTLQRERRPDSAASLLKGLGSVRKRPSFSDTAHRNTEA